MQSILDFLSFKIFISPYILIACYFVGAFIIPIASIIFAKWLQSKYQSFLKQIPLAHEVLSQLEFKHYIHIKQRIIFISLILFIFISLEIMWRMMFEFLIAYLQIREALLSITASL